jgi:3-oxoacyl-(acyl-carrier-protein) synthase
VQIAAEIKNFDAKPYFASPKSAVRNDRYTLLGVAAAKLAVQDAQLDVGTITKGACGGCHSHYNAWGKVRIAVARRASRVWVGSGDTRGAQWMLGRLHQ